MSAVLEQVHGMDLTYNAPFMPDQVDISWMASADGTFISYTPQPFMVRHFGAVT